MSKTRIGVIAAAGAGIAGVLLGAPLISSATTPSDTSPDTGATTTTTGGTTGDSSSGDTTPGTTNGDGTGTSDGTADDARCRQRGRGGRRGPGHERPGGRGPGGDQRGRGSNQRRGDRPGGIIDRDELAELLGVTQDELRTSLKDGDSIADVATAQGVDVDVVIDSLVEDAQARITEHRDRINERLDERSGAVEERITDIVTGD